MSEELVINDEKYCGSYEDYDAIQEAIKKLYTASQNQFESIKKEKWYNRVFDMITFSKKREKRLAEQVSTLAQAQQILTEILCRLSDSDSNISKIVRDSMKDIRKITEQNNFLFSKIQHLENVVLGIKRDMDIKSLSESAKEVLCACLYYLCNKSEETSVEQQKYANTVINYVGVADVQMENPILEIEKMNTDEKIRILSCCMEYLFLKDCSEGNYTEYEEFISEFDIGNKSMESIKEKIRCLYQLRGCEGFYTKFQQYEIEEDMDDELFLLDEEDEPAITCLEEDYSEIRSMISGIVAEMISETEKQKSWKEKGIFNFIRKYKSDICFDAAIEYISMEKTEILFTISGIYAGYKRLGPVYIKYTDIDDKCLTLSSAKMLKINSKKGTELRLRGEAKYINGIVNILSNANRYTTAETDLIVGEKEWPGQVKVLAGEILADIFKIYSGTSTVEAGRLLNDLSVTREQMLGFLTYVDSSEPSEKNITEKIELFKRSIPYPSQKMAGFRLLSKVVEMVQYSSGETDDLPVVIKDYIIKICDICNLYEFYDGVEYYDDVIKGIGREETVDKLWERAARSYQELKLFQHNGDLWRIEKSYLDFYAIIQEIKEDNKRSTLTDLIIKAAGRTDASIEKCLKAYANGEHAKDKFYIQEIQEKLSAISTRNKSGYYLMSLSDMGEYESVEVSSKLLEKTYDVPVNNQTIKLQHHQVLEIFASNKRNDTALIFTYEGMAITKKMSGDGKRLDKFVYYENITSFKEEREKSLLYISVDRTYSTQNGVVIRFDEPERLKELLLKLRMIRFSSERL